MIGGTSACSVLAALLVAAVAGDDGGTEANASPVAPENVRRPAGEPPPSNGRALSFLLSSEPQVHDVNVAFAYTTSLWFPVGCHAPAVGDKNVCGVVYNDKNKTNRFFILTPVEKRVGDDTNVTFRCEQGVKVVLRATQTTGDKAHFSVKFEFDPEETERVRLAVERERERAAIELDTEVARAKTESAAASEEAFLRGLLKRFSVEEDVEYGRKDFVVAKVFREIVVGGRGNILFQVKNHTDNDITLAGATLQEEKSGRVLDGAVMVTADPVVAAGSATLGVLAFDVDTAPGPLKLTIHENGPREIVVDDIEF